MRNGVGGSPALSDIDDEIFTGVPRSSLHTPGSKLSRVLRDSDSESEKCDEIPSDKLNDISDDVAFEPIEDYAFFNGDYVASSPLVDNDRPIEPQAADVAVGMGYDSEAGCSSSLATDSECCVCKSSVTEIDNPIIFCDGCDVMVHLGLSTIYMDLDPPLFC